MFDSQKKPTEEQKALERLLCRGIIAVLCVVGCALLLPVCWRLLSPFIIAVPIAAMLQPVIRFLRNKCRLSPFLSVLIPVLLVLALVCAAIYWFASFGFAQLNEFIAGAPALLSEGVTSIRTAFESLLASFNTLPEETVTWLRSAMNEALSWLTVQGTTLGARAVTVITGMAAGIPNAFIYLNFLIIGIYFITKEYAGVRAKLPGGKAHDPNSNASQLTKAGIRGALGYLRVQSIYGLISLVAGIIYFSCFHYRYAVLIALVAAFLEFLPLFGNGTIYIPWSIIAYVLGMPTIGTEVIVLYLLLITFRRITEPKVMSANIGVSPLASLVGMFVGLETGGIIGLIGGPIVMTLLGAIVQGNYLNGIRRDIRTLVSYFRRRWDWGEKVPFTPPPEEEAPEEKPAHHSFGRRKKKD